MTVQIPSTSRRNWAPTRCQPGGTFGELFQPALSRLPVCVEYADRLDPQKMSFPVAEAAGLRESVYFMENVFRDGTRGVENAVEALAKVQQQADELPQA